MSEGEERESLSREIDPAIWAVAPRLHQEEGPVDVSASPAFQCLDEVSFGLPFTLLHKMLLSVGFLKNRKGENTVFLSSFFSKSS